MEQGTDAAAVGEIKISRGGVTVTTPSHVVVKKPKHYKKGTKKGFQKCHWMTHFHIRALVVVVVVVMVTNIGLSRIGGILAKKEHGTTGTTSENNNNNSNKN